MSTGPATATAGPREVAAWACYDFANSGYTTVVLTTVYNAYFVGVIAAQLDTRSPGLATLLWTLAIGASNLIVLTCGPIVGALADYHAAKKRFLLLSSVLCIGATAALAAAVPGAVVPAVALVVVSATAFALGEGLIAAFLPEIATEDRMGRISGYGWGLGYCGGLLTLGCCLAWIEHAVGRGLAPAQYVPVVLLITAAIFAGAAAPTFIWLRERAVPRPLPPGTGWLQAAFSQVGGTLRHAGRLPDLFRFLACQTCYQAGVSTVVVVAAIYAQEVVGFDDRQLIVLIMVVNVTAALGAFGFGHAQDYFGSVPTLAAALLTWIAAILVALAATGPGQLWLSANLIGLAMGASQAGGRALVGNLTPESRSGEIFGLWGLANRAAAIIGPVSYGLINHWWADNHRTALLSTLGFFVLGLALLCTVNEQRGRAARKGSDAQSASSAAVS